MITLVHQLLIKSLRTNADFLIDVSLFLYLSVDTLLSITAMNERLGKEANKILIVMKYIFERYSSRKSSRINYTNDSS